MTGKDCWEEIASVAVHIQLYCARVEPYVVGVYPDADA